MIITSIDFETANYSHASICAAGLAVFEDGNLIESKHWLVRPPKGHGWFREDFVECHGIDWFDVRNEPEFPGIAPEFLAGLARADLVIAHNVSFDMTKLQGTLEHFELPLPSFDYFCTLEASRKVWPELPSHGLGALAAHIGHQFKHHNAQDDAEAAGRVLYELAQTANASTIRDLICQHGINVARFGGGG